ncbi:cysteine desulfurase [Tunicatimonas pelagia]|uniref:cysteine desulfurase n=1 Tax=Tunicatimonas pelagia TaxID=931531 RepID=UPI0026658081|nr:cysteine desulfurase [Tunicatimonas pelagia]WKN43597.1 cysteine desulfurase [Tunicatimonas pelagia]
MSTENTVVSTTQLDIDQIRSDFPILHQEVNGRPLVYLDNAATTQKPQVVIDALTHYYQQDNANIHRGVHTLAERATAVFEETRQAIHQFINSNEPEEIVFTKGTTDGINLVAATFGRTNLKEGDEIIISGMEHHSNIVPWQMLCEEKGAKLKVIPVNERGEVELEEYKKLLSARTKLVSVVYVSNSLGTINPVKEIIDLAHAQGAAVLIDGAQSTAYLDIDVQALNCDFYIFSGHKVFGPTGVGALYGKRRLLEKMPPYQGGGEMIRSVSFEKTTYNDIPYKFEAGTPNIADVVALKAAIDYINQLGKPAMRAYEEELLAYAHQRLSEVSGLRMIGTAEKKMNVVSFVFDDIFHFDVGQMLDARGIAVRTGHHCTEPLMAHFGLEGTVRASFAMYNKKEEIDQLVEGLQRIVKMMGK